MQTEAVERSEVTALERAAIQLAQRRIAVSMRNRGYTYESIGNALGMSRQRAHQIVNEKEH